jgi:dimethylaniline monooxygenase (N-oxide forming)
VGKKVLVVGTGETAADLTKELVDHGAAHVFVSKRGPTITLPRNYLSTPPDYVENRVTYSGPMFHRWAMVLSTLPPLLWDLINPRRFPPPAAKYWFQLMTKNANPMAGFPSIMGSVNTTKSDHLWIALDTGKASLVAGLEAITKTGAVAKGGERIDVDAIIYCTGYRTSNAFLPAAKGSAKPNPERPLTARDMYKLTIHPDHPTLALIGFARGLIGAITLSSELQSRWWALIVSGKRQLPSTEKMNADVRYLRGKSKRFGQATRTTMTFANSIARHEIGCEPDLFKLFLTDQKLWLRVWNGVMCNAHYRLFGVHAKPQLAREQLTMPVAYSDPNYIDSADLAHHALPLSCLVIPLWSLASKLLPAFVLRSALSSYV